MTRNVALAAFTVLALGSGSLVVHAHHSGTMFDEKKEVTIEGVVKEFQYTNPHSWLLVDVTNADGTITTWGFEAEGPSTMMQRKVRRSDFAPGTKVRITGHPMKDGRPAAAWTKGVRLDDGMEFYPRGGGPETASVRRPGLRADGAADPAVPTFHKDILPIFQKNCQSCHRPGQIGPMPLLTYEQARPWARAIKAKVVAREMPPWFADPHYNEFANDRRLSDRDLETIVRWTDAGAAAGSPHDAPPPVAWAPHGWQIPPDLVIDAVEYQVPATGVVEWINITVPSGFTRDTWVSSVEVRPGDLSVVHHVCVSWVPHQAGAKYRVPQWQDKARDESGAELAQVAAERAQGPRREEMPGGRLHCYVPGIAAVDFRLHGAATLVPAGADLIFSLHYNPNGKAAVDLTRVGFTTAKAPPRRQYISLSLNPSRERKYFAIPPNTPNWQAPTAEAEFMADADLISLVYHMHDRGKDATTRLHFPDGRSETVLRVPRYDFNWQLTYEFRQPIRIPKGTRAQFDAHFDNTRRGGFLKPNSWVYWGDQTWEEMMGNWFGLLIDRTIDPNDVMKPIGTSSVLGGGEEG